MRKGELRFRHKESVVLFLFLLGTMLLISVPFTTNVRLMDQTLVTNEKSLSEPVLNGMSERLRDFITGESRNLKWASWESVPQESPQMNAVPPDVDPFGTSHPAIYIDDNSDFETQSWPGEGTVEQPYIIADLNINATSLEGAAINISNTDVHFFIKDCWLTSNETSVIELNSVSHGRIANNTILGSERGVVALHSDDLTIYDNLFYSFNWAGVYLEDCSLSTLRNNNCTTCFIGLHVEQSNNILIEKNYCSGCLGGIEIYFECEEITIYNNTLIDNDVGIGLYLDCINNLIDSNNCTANLVFGIYSQGCQDNDITKNYGRFNIADIFLENCTSHTIKDNDSGATTGAGPEMYGSIVLSNSNNSIITDNHVENSFVCIDLREGSSFNEVVNNTCFYYAGGVVLWDNAPHNTIENNICSGNGYGEVDIYIDSSPYCTVTENQCNESMFNIFSYYSNNTQIVDNDCDLSTEASIWILESYYSLVEGNTLTNGSTGIVLEDVTYTSAIDNHVTNFTGTWMGGPTGIHLTAAYNSSVVSNYITDCNVAVLAEQSVGCNITENDCIANFDGIVVVASCYEINVDNNYCHLQEGYSLVVVESFDCVVAQNTCTNTSGAEGFCLLLEDCSTNATENSFSLSTGGIEVYGNDGVITKNIIEDNELYGITLQGLIGSNVTWNVFEDNGVNAIDNSTASLFDYNFWSNYIGVDSNADGIGDTWHPIQGTANNNDTHPLVYHPTLPTWSPEPEDQVAELGHAFNYVLSYTTSTELAPIVDWWVNDTTHFAIGGGTVTNTGFLDLGEYPLEVKAINLYGFELSGTFTVTVADTIAPSIIGPDDFDYVAGQVGRSITWIPEDYDPASYSVMLDGIEVMSGAWNSTSENVTISVDGLSVGVHTFVVTFVDGSGNTATDTVTVTVIPDFTPLFLVAGVGGAAVVIIIVVYLIRKKGARE